MTFKSFSLAGDYSPLARDMGGGERSWKEEVRGRTNHVGGVCLQRALHLPWHPSCAKTPVLGFWFVLC